MNKLPHWVLTDSRPAFYDSESATAIQQTAKLYGAMQELIDAYNQFVDLVNDHMDEQDDVIAAAVQYMKDNLVETIKVLNADGELDHAIVSAISAVESEVEAAISNIQNEVDKQQQEMDQDINNINSVVSKLASGSPLTASSTSGMTDTNSIYVNTTDGNWYYYNGSTWVSGGVYQGAQISSDDVQIDGRNTEITKLPSYYGHNRFDGINNLTNGYIINEGVGTNISFGNSTTRVTIAEGAYLTPGTYKFINLNTAKYAATYIVVDNTTNLITRLYTWASVELFNITVSTNEILYIVFKEVNNATLTVNEIANNFKICVGSYEPDNFQLYIPYNTKNPKIDALNKKMYVYSGTKVLINQRIYTVSTDQTINYSSVSGNKAIIIFNVRDSQFAIIDPDTTVNYPFIHIGFFTTSGDMSGTDIGFVITHHSIPDCFELWGKTLTRTVGLKNIFNLDLQNIVNTSITAMGNNSNIRVSHTKPINYNGKVTIVNKDNTKYRFAINSINQDYSKVLSDTGWITSTKYNYHFNNDYDHYINFSRIDNGVLSKEEIEENFTIYPYDYSSDITENVTENASIYKPILKNFHSVGHQGYGIGGNGYRGNSRSGFAAAALHGFTDVECDVQITSDNVMVLNHDATITDDEGTTLTIANLTYAELLTHTFDGETIATLEELFCICKQYGVNVYIDKSENYLKNNSVKENLHFLVRKHQMDKRVTFVAYSYDVQTLSNLFPCSRILVRNITLSNDFMVSYIQPYQTAENEIGFSLDYSQYGNDNTYNFISNYDRTPLEFWTIDNTATYLNVMKYTTGITSNALTAYDVLTAE